MKIDRLPREKPKPRQVILVPHENNFLDWLCGEYSRQHRFWMLLVFPLVGVFLLGLILFQGETTKGAGALVMFLAFLGLGSVGGYQVFRSHSPSPRRGKANASSSLVVDGWMISPDVDEAIES